MVCVISRSAGDSQNLFYLFTWCSSGQLRGTHCHTHLCHGLPPRNSMTPLCLFLWEPTTIIPECVTHSITTSHTVSQLFALGVLLKEKKRENNHI